jgi:hypothetical protein
MPNFIHRFDPAAADPVGSTCALSTIEIENAGLLEILQTPGAPVGHWGLFDPLLDPGNPDFVFRETLGKSREVKTAISGLFGRFVARAYATRYLNFTHFAHIHSPPMRLHRLSRALVVRRPRHRGDLPDWAVWSPRMGMGIVEAKGTHAPAGPGRILASAYRQAERVEIQIGGRRARFKRYAIATRWGFLALGSPSQPILAVKDPVEEGEDVSEEQLAQAGVGIARRHMASLLRPLGHVELASALDELAETSFRNREAFARTRVEALLDTGESKTVRRGEGLAGEQSDDLIGGFVTRGGVIAEQDVSVTDQETLQRLKLSPCFIGIERNAIKAALDGDVSTLLTKQVEAKLRDDLPRGQMDGGGTTIVRLDERGTEII